MRSRLFGATIFNRVLDVVEADINNHATDASEPDVETVPGILAEHPHPGVAINITQATIRVSLVDEDRSGLSPTGRYGCTLRRASDNTVLSSTTLNWSPRWGQTTVAVEQSLDFGGNAFLLEPDDELTVQVFALGIAGQVRHVRARVTVLYSLDEPDREVEALESIEGQMPDFTAGLAALSDAVADVTPAVDGVAAALAALDPHLESIDAHLGTIASVKDKFVQVLWVSTGNFLLGLKDDGTLWKASSPGADPLVWVNVTT